MPPTPAEAAPADARPPAGAGAGAASVSVVIATRDRAESLRRTLASIGRQGHAPAEVIVVDDGSAAPLGDLGPGVRLLRNETSRGASYSRNRGLAEARGDFLLFLDDDVEFLDDGAIARAVELAGRHADCAMIGFKQVDPAGAPHEDQPSRADRPASVGKFYSYACLGRRRALAEVGGFEPMIAYYYEEIELGMRLLDAGHAILYDPGLAVVHHYDPAGRDWRRILRLALRNSYYAAVLRYPWWLVPAMVASYAANHLRATRSRFAARDWGGLPFALGSVARDLAPLLRRRRPVRFATLRLMKRRGREPEPLA